MHPIRKGPVTVGAVVDFIREECILPETREPMELHPFQLELLEEWMDPATKAHATVIGAGNAKTTTLGAFIAAHIYLVDEASVPVVADTVTQAVLTTWGKVKRFVELNPRLASRAEILEGQGSRRGIYVPGMASHVFPIASAPSGLQGLNPSVAVLEEMSEATMSTFGALMNRLGKRRESKLIGISTPSFTPDNALITVQRAFESGEPMPGVALRQYVSDQKDHRDETGWHQANPGLVHGFPDVAAIRADLALLPEQQFRAYRLCQNPVGAASCWLNSLDEQGQETGDAYEVWKRLERPRPLTEGAPTWAGVDVARTRDNAAIVWGQFSDDGRPHAVSRVWVPTSTDPIELEELADHLHKLRQMFDLRAVWFDPSYFYNAAQLERDGLPMVEVPPSEQRMSPIVGHAYQIIRKGRMTHNGDEQLQRHVLAARRRYGPHGFTIEKRQFEHKIDAAVALCLFLAAATGLDPTPEWDSFTIGVA